MRGPSPSRARDRPSQRTTPSVRALEIITRLSPLKRPDPHLASSLSSPSSLSLDGTTLSPPASSRSSSSSWRRGAVAHHSRTGSLSLYRPPDHDITALATSLNPFESWRVLRRRRWRLLDTTQPILGLVILFSLWVVPSAPLIKTGVVLALVGLLMVPATGQFLLPSLPIWTYLLYFFCSSFIPVEWRPSVSVTVLPAMEHALFGTSLSHLLSAHTHPVLDILAWLPYGIGHFAMPAFCSLAFFLYAAPGTTPAYARAFGWMSVLGVTMQIVLPTTPPWYEDLHGLQEPALYGMGGSPAGLARIDQLFGVDMYTTSFTTNPIPYGAFPSLHGGNAVLQALFVSHCFPRKRVWAAVYVCWIWWATMYLGHHYAVDLIGGGLIAAAFFLVVNRYWLPRAQMDKLTRWEYDHVEIGTRRLVPDVERRPGRSDSIGSIGSSMGLKELGRRHRTTSLASSSSSSSSGVGGSDDEWAAASSSSLWSGGGRGGGGRPGSSSSSTVSGGSSPASPRLSDDDLYLEKQPPPRPAGHGRMASAQERKAVIVV